MKDPTRLDHSVRVYNRIKRFLLDHGFGDEIRWQEEVLTIEISEAHFLRESAWVVLSAGMREAIVRKVFGRISESFHDWRSAALIVATSAECVRSARAAFDHSRKIQAIADIAKIVEVDGFSAIQSRLASNGVTFLMELPYIGPVTCYHLAKNLGMNVVKPDRHLMRACAASGYSSPAEMCSEISAIVGDAVAVIDLVIWRYATIDPRYVDLFETSDNRVGENAHQVLA